MDDSVFSLALTHLWQINVLFLLIALFGCCSWARRRAHLMLLLWVLFFVKCLIPPVVQSPFSPMALMTPKATASRIVEDQPGSNSIGSGASADAFAAGSGQGKGDSSLASNHTSSVFSWRLVKLTWISGSVVAWLAIVGNFLLVRRRIVAGAIDLQHSESFANAKMILARLQEQLGMDESSTRLVISDTSLGPLVFGFWRPTIVLPKEMCRGDVRLKPIVAHELCHVWRRDHLLGFLQIAAQVLFWFHPFVWIASKRVNRLCEVCCDDDAMRIFDLNSKTYAGGLLDVLSMQRIVKSVGIAPGIRPVEVTRQRLKLIVDRRRSKTRQSQIVIVCIFLCLVVPAISSGSRAISEKSDQTDTRARILMDEAEVAIRRSEMDFLLGAWDVSTNDGVPAGESIFAYEKSGKMIREDWTDPDGSTAQGITFYDPNETCWKMTWVDSSGVIMESSGQWSGEALTLSGEITSRTGNRRDAQTVISRVNETTLSCELRIKYDGTMKTVSQSIYRRSVD